MTSPTPLPQPPYGRPVAPPPGPGYPVGPRTLARMRSIGWLTTALAPLAAVFVAWFVAFLSALTLPGILDSLAAELAGDYGPGSSFSRSWLTSEYQADYVRLALYSTAFALCGAYKSVVEAAYLGESVSVSTTVWFPALTLTVFIGLMIYAAHRFESRRLPRNALTIWGPAAISGAVLSLTTLVLRPLASQTYDLGEDLLNSALGSYGDTSDLGVTANITPSLLGLLLGFLLGALPVALARSFGERPTSGSRFAFQTRRQGRTTLHALRICLAFLLFTPLATGVLNTFLLVNDTPLPVTAVIFAVPFLYNIGVYTMLGSFGGLAHMSGRTNFPGTFSTGSGSSIEETHAVFESLPSMHYTAIIVVVAGLIASAIVWGRTRDPFTQRTPWGWLAIPTLSTVLGIVLIIVDALRLSGNIPDLGYGSGAGQYGVTLSLSWLSILWFFGFGLLLELASRAFSTLGSSTPPATYPAAAPQAGGPQPGTPYGMMPPTNQGVHPGGPAIGTGVVNAASPTSPTPPTMATPGQNGAPASAAPQSFAPPAPPAPPASPAAPEHAEPGNQAPDTVQPHRPTAAPDAAEAASDDGTPPEE
ncbi:hypothetical protein [Actinobaculum sp. 352]|uniref:hypothetical protein n=1 Tax=Actinobaculum sp. 352 TaxID=2490946 RepID=UPI000F7EF712|nr:hypothetical protein [Actinobaculum sp. 352]RTE48976.1 hypothetical protein EKN07_07520 [Actinobaculum sp. 352]